jgi:hypothetical protein
MSSENVIGQAAYAYAIWCGINKLSVGMGGVGLLGSVKCDDVSMAMTSKRSSNLPCHTAGYCSICREEL